MHCQPDDMASASFLLLQLGLSSEQIVTKWNGSLYLNNGSVEKAKNTVEIEGDKTGHIVIYIYTPTQTRPHINSSSISISSSDYFDCVEKYYGYAILS